MSYIKKILAVIGVSTILSMSLSGCSLPEDIQSNISNAFRERSRLNISLANELYNSGIISEDTFNLLSTDINQNLEKFGESIKNASSDSGKNLWKACVGWRVADPDDYEDIVDLDAFHKQFLTNLVVENPDVDSGHKSNAPAIGGNGLNIKPIEVISESTIAQMNEELSVPIYVLRGDMQGIGLDGVIEAVKQAEANKNEAGLTQYFEQAKYTDENGVERNLTLMDTTNPDEQIVRVTSGSSAALEDYKVTSTVSQSNTDPLPCSYGVSSNAPGKDMIISMAGEEIMMIRLIEFNEEAIDDLKKELGLGEQRYLLLNGRAYLMEYPVGYIAGFTEDPSNRSQYHSVIEQSNIGFNLLTGDFSKFTVENGKITNQSVVTSDKDPYLTFNGAKNSSAESQASLALFGETGASNSIEGSQTEAWNPCWDLSLGTYITETGSVQPRLYSSGRIVLRDYLEATYAPGVTSENLIVLGRKLRILNFEGDKSNKVAEFYDKEGKKLGEDNELYINDFADVESLISSDPTVKYISKINEPLSSNSDSSGSSSEDTLEQSILSDDSSEDTLEQSILSDDSSEDTLEQSILSDDSSEDTLEQSDSEDTSGSDDFEIEDTIQGSAMKIDKLKQIVVDEVRPSTPFPGEYIGRSDVNYEDDKPQFYAMVVKKSMFETGLFSGWIQSTDAEQNSTVWWKNWLGNHGFNYDINPDNLVSYLKGNYAFDLNKENIIILDLETIAKIQQEYNKESDMETSHSLRSIFAVFGYGLIAYSIILLIAWNVDVNVDLGFGILEKLSFGKWVAVKDYEEMPELNTEETNFIKFGQLVLSCIGISALGIALILVNIVDLIILIIQLFGGIAEYVTRIITGVR